MANLCDILTTESGDWDVTAQGDIGILTGPELRVASLKRRFMTPLGGLFYDSTYGNAMWFRLSSPMTSSFADQVKTDSEQCILADPNVQSVVVDVTLNPAAKTVDVSIIFTDTDGTSGSFAQGVPMLV